MDRTARTCLNLSHMDGLTSSLDRPTIVKSQSSILHSRENVLPPCLALRCKSNLTYPKICRETIIPLFSKN